MTTRLNVLVLKDRIQNLLTGKESVNQFCYKAVEERVNRLEARNDRARLQAIARDKKLLEPLLDEMLRERGIYGSKKHD